jgi:chitin disaccharide deacetylase
MPNGIRGGVLIMNADDWGRDRETTQRIFECVLHGTVSSASAMVFMEDSERAAAVAREARIDTGLHVNFTTPFSAPNCPRQLLVRQADLARHLQSGRLARAVFHPGLLRSFEYVMKSQLDEYGRLYGAYPGRIDGHHHMHLCANVLFGRLMPAGTIARRSFSLRPGEKNFFKRKYGQLLDFTLARRHRLTDYFFSLPPLQPVERLRRIFSLAHRFVVEVETHPVNAEEHQFLMGERIHQLLGELRISKGFIVPQGAQPGATPIDDPVVL